MGFLLCFMRLQLANCAENDVNEGNAFSMFRSSLMVSAIAVLASCASFMNQLVLARLFGAGGRMDSYLLAISLPLSATGLAIGVLGYQLVPALQRAQMRVGSSDPLVKSLVWALGIIAGVLAVGGILASGPLLRRLAPTMSTEQAAAAVYIARIAWLWLPLGVISSIYTAGLHVKMKFVFPTALQSAPIIGSLVFCLLWHRQLGIYSIAWGQLAGYIALVLGLRAVFGQTLMRIEHRREVYGVLQQLPLALAASIVFVIFPISDAFWGSRIGPATVSYLGYAQRLIVGFSGVAVVGATTVIFPKLAKHAAVGNDGAFKDNLAVSIRMMLSCMLPAAILLSVFSLTTVQLLFQRGAFKLEDAYLLATFLPYMLVGMLAMSCTGLIFKALFAGEKLQCAAFLSLFGALSYFTLSGVFSRLLGGVGVALAYGVCWFLIMAGGLGFLWWGDIVNRVSANMRFGARLAIAGLGLLLIGCLGHRFLPDESSANQLLRLLVEVATASVGGIFYIVVCNTVLAVEEVQIMTRQVFGMLIRT